MVKLRFSYKAENILSRLATITFLNILLHGLWCKWIWEGKMWLFALAILGWVWCLSESLRNTNNLDIYLSPV